MATIKIIQDRKHRRADGTYRLKLSVSHKQATRHIALDICLPAEHWDTKRERAVRCFGSAGINTHLDRTLAEVRQLLISLRVAGVLPSLDIPKETIAHALGHGAKSVTDIYIDFDRTKVDEANRKVIDYVLQKKGGTSATL